MAVKKYHYIECGLENVYLLNGFKKRSTPYGQAVSIDGIDDLHRAIARFLVHEKKTLNGKEIRFLRHEMKYSQNRLAALLGVDQQTIARWEKGPAQASGPGDRMIRVLYSVLDDGQSDIAKVLKNLAELDTRLDRELVFKEIGGDWQPAQAA